VLTILVVVVTANHWWLDGIVAVAILALCAWSVYGVRTAWRELLARRQPSLASAANLTSVPEKVSSR
jgi:hypothetical protein